MVGRWAGSTAVIIASGPSLTIEDCDSVRQWREAVDGKCIAINTSYKRAPWADVLYACDDRWWSGLDPDTKQPNINGVKRDFGGELWTQDVEAARKHGLQHIRSRRAEGLSKNHDVIHQGFNSGYQSINMAYNWGARRMLLVGYDMQDDGKRTHWHKPHDAHIKTPYDQCLLEFRRLAIDLKAAGAEVVNCTRKTALTSFDMGELDAELGRPVQMAAD